MSATGSLLKFRRRRIKRPWLRPLTIPDVLWLAALDRVPIEDRIEWVEKMKQRVAEINAVREVRRG